MPSTIKPLMTGGLLALGLAGPLLIPNGAPAWAAPTTAPAAASAAAQGTAPAVSGPPAATARSHGYGVRLTQFNILASTMRSGGLSRAHRAAHWVQEQHATAAAFEEVAADQLPRLQQTMTGYRFWPRREFGTRGSAIQIAWRTREVSLRQTGHVMGPFLGHSRPVPYVRLRDRHTHRTFWVMAIHNAPGGHEGERESETRAEIARIKQLLHTDDPIFVLGDVNERSEFCTHVARATPLRSLNGGTRRHSCPVPRSGGPDWMLGVGARASHFREVYNHISDHPALTVRAHVPAVR